ncbi:MAG: SGNH/GDSL hydrolase family protein [Acidimicrobiales bacterium]
MLSEVPRTTKAEIPAKAASRWQRYTSIVTALTVVAAACVIVQLVAGRLRQPELWPTPEAQHKAAQIAGLARAHQVIRAVLVGDSLMDAGADPASMGAAGPTTYNASLAGEELPVLTRWVTGEVDPRLHPRLVVIGFSSNVLNANLPGAAAGAASFNASRVVRSAEGRGDVLDNINLLLDRHVALYRDRTVLRAPFAPAKSPDAFIFDPPLTNQGADEVFRKGELLPPGVDPAAALRAGRLELDADLLHRFEISPANEQLLARFIDQLRSAGIAVVFVAMPVSSDYVAAHPGGPAQYQAALADLHRIATSHKAIFRFAGIWPAQDYADPAHLNATGTRRFSAWLEGVVASACAPCVATR